MTPQDREYVRTLVREHVREATKRGTTLWPATVASAADAGADVEVTLDGGGASIPAQNITGQGLGADQRVMVTLVPPHGVFVSHLISSAGGLATQTVLDADTASIALTVPAGVNEFEVRASLRSNRAALVDSIAVRLNSDAAASYLTGYVYHSGTTPKAFTEADVGRFYAGECHGNTAAAALRSACRIDAFDVANTAAHKEGTAESAVAGTLRHSLAWRWPKVDAVTLVELRPWFGTLWKSGSSARLYAR